MKHNAALLGLTLCLSQPAIAEVYKSVDSQGNVTFSDESSSGAEPVEVKSVPTITLPKADQVREVIEASESGKNKPQAAAYDRVSFDAPDDESAFWSGGGSVAFAVSSSPSLKQGHQYEVTLDGQPIGQNSSGQFTVDIVNRGSHDAAVNIIGSSGEIIQSGSTISFTIHRPSSQN